MALKKLPVRGDIPNYEIQVVLDSVQFGLEFQWNERCSCWTFDLKDSAGNILIGSIQVTVNYPVTYRFKTAGLPTGVLFFWDSTGQGMDPIQLNDLGNRVLLMYQEAATV